ncbi:MAG: hypothetical protein JETCAE02_13150 [Anaerolineaceae bacterium]|jgi:hypothetical protein|nr:DUF4258 domain-containing protein [Anaerolineae bacterium]MBL1172723.1 DUF4258 domain-containing protein [Chloroflexota bacterium]MDL1926433.1 DUF4258 domain-containing protein [Anaerolineae bacterium AMX1]WKZ50903.1 MAG: DUF4258 domain-containing protein [Anaerolineales bacterium]GJQ38903.1 MAG: hypothetical protein JETCAE02_13150 [Anaerolineaceae bacterium]
MPPFDFTIHARDMLAERKIPEDWVWRVLNDPDETHIGDDGNMHYTKVIQERDGRILHVVVNPNVQLNRIVTLFFDRRLTRTK